MQKKIIVVGTGYVGLPAALMWAKAGTKVVGVDINENVVRAINERTMLLNEAELNDMLNDPEVQANLTASTTPCEGDIFVIAVPTPVDSLKKVADMSYVESALHAIIPFLRKGNLIILESTVPPMTCRRVVKPLIEKHTTFKVPDDIHVTHCPERILPGDIFHEIVHNDRLIGGMDQQSTDLAADAYAIFVKGTLHKTDDVTAELSKLMENTYRDVNIAIANEFSAICEDLGVDAYQVIGFANKHPRVKILTPGIGVGGHCIPVDPWFLKEVAPLNSRLISMARLVNDDVPHRMAAKIRRSVKDIPNPKILLLGATYKRNCEDTRESPASEIAHLLQEDGYDIIHRDPLVPGMGYETLASVAQDSHQLVVLVAHDQIMSELKESRDSIEAAMSRPSISVFDR
jgi:UDP-N-acetyl-D-mannosaminuronic acid dehydrogenase